MHNLLTDPLIRTQPLGNLTLPGVLAALMRDEIATYTVLRPHQSMFWHMFCVQLAVMALKENRDIPEDEAAWYDLLSAMTSSNPENTAWSLIVDDWTKPAFMQAAVPADVALKNDVPTPDALDMLITAKNHDIKQATAVNANEDDWLFALVTLQTGEGFNGKGNYGIARMNGGSSSRSLFGLAPVIEGQINTPRPGAWFERDIKALQSSNIVQNLGFKSSEGIGLTWLQPWPEDNQLQISDLDQNFIEICRRVRLMSVDGCISAKKGNSKVTRVNAKDFHGAVGDPWAPVHKTEGKAFTLGEGGDFDYRKIIEIMFSGNWEIPALAKTTPFETPNAQLLLVTQAFARGNSKTSGFRSRSIPIVGKVAAAFGQTNERSKLYKIGREQAEVVKHFQKMLGYALVVAVACGDVQRIDVKYYDYARPAQVALNRYADSIFFLFLWKQFGGSETNAKSEFIRKLWRKTQEIFEQFLPTMPVASFMRPKSDARARGGLIGSVMSVYSDFLNENGDREHEVRAEDA